MGNDNPDFLDPVAFDGAMKGVRAGLSLYGIEADDEICTQVAVSVLTGFAITGGLQPESLERLRDLVVRAATARQEH
ncbi:hypothetical protein [Methylobacterium sp. GC_Met_2]|uniref:hypothetical protein n=1 Tax=Methylobacterium sp. GC_Met_2 TaxID=2937376 RepID=UPI00226BB160|nr:hypothetical protein [Methylobacterium sp. GC_Met_2]